ncbi:sigma 54-interacting transcriptional regulator [Thermodesulfobacteriota bacterium]
MKSNQTILNSDFYQAMSDSLYDGVLATDANGSIILFNDAAKRILNIKNRHVIGRHLKDINPGAWADFREIMKNGTSQLGKKIQINDLTAIANRTPVKKNGKIIGVVSVFQDISEFDNIAKELNTYKELVKQLDAIVETSYDGLYITDRNEKTLRVNPSWSKITGLSAAEVVGKNTSDLERDGFISKSVASMILKHGKSITTSAHVKTGKEVLVTGTPVFDENGNVSIVVLNVRDMTDLNRLNRQIKKTKQQTQKYKSKLKNMQQLSLKMDSEIVAVSKPIKDIIDLALRIARVNIPVLIQGETGVGKEAIAKFIHNNSDNSKNGQFMKINCGAIPSTLLESELFGYEKGAFTGASTQGKRGLFEMAKGGTVFLDEIQTLPLNLQAKLLNVLQDFEIMRVGGVKTIKINARIITASNQELFKMVQNNTFREDLFFRLNVVPINIPPIRERKDDILPLVNFFLRKYNAKYKKNKTINRSVLDYLVNYPWRGNIREISNLMERLVVMSHDDEILIEDLPSYISNQEGFKLPYIEGDNGGLKNVVQKYECQLIKEAIKKYGNSRKAAKFLGVDPSTITRKLKKMGVELSYLNFPA